MNSLSYHFTKRLMSTRLLILPALAALLVALTGCTDAPESPEPETTPEPVFEAQTLDPDVGVGYGLAIGDVDGDGNDDVMMVDETEVVWYRNGDWQKFVIAENLTERDNVAIAADDIDGDGQVEIAVGAQWNPGETSDAEASGAVFYLIRPDDPTQHWEAVQLHNEPTVHRMHWAETGGGEHALVVLPLHGRGNQGGEGAGVRVLAYQMPDDPQDEWETVLLDSSLNVTHNFDVKPEDGFDRLYIGGRQGAITVAPQNSQWMENSAEVVEGIALEDGIGEIRYGTLGSTDLITTIEPFHGNTVNVYLLGDSLEHHELANDFNQGHALASADLLGIGRDQIVAGWRNANDEGKVGIKMWVPDETGSEWTEYVVDDNTMATEDMKVADLDGDGRQDIIAAGRDSHNLIIYWNRTDGDVTEPI